MTDESKPVLCMEECIERVQARLEHLLQKETRVGASTPNRILPEDDPDKEVIKPDKVSKDEFIGRIKKLERFLSESTESLDPTLRAMAEGLDMRQPEILLQCTGEEFDALRGEGDDITFNRQALLSMFIQIRQHQANLGNARAELRRASMGFLGAPVRRGRPGVRRGKEIAAMLLGFAEGLGLTATTSKSRLDAPGTGSAVQAITEAVRRTTPPADPTARAVYDQIPTGYDPIANLLQDLESDEALHRYHAVNKEISGREAKTPN